VLEKLLFLIITAMIIGLLAASLLLVFYEL
jgi:hypothetical protein